MYKVALCVVGGLVGDVGGELGGEVIYGVHCRGGLHGGRSVKKGPIALSHHFHQEDLQQHLGKLLPHAHPGPPPEGDVLEAGGGGGGGGAGLP